ncbi:hypothetical protein [Gloeobacter morelensis]|uniref:DUF3106 domain-containing protein n=1 Tax=Gloeobacter morelensis MG652769 TaxID=2781736 RepID=A0ABY3PHV4_9CYAN|nr:hypothetical protein [Gloeobacter morelensis]UFP93247.1 hypothetical protein ISF26_15740 [Gloeobacter morelensis MG652769]
MRSALVLLLIGSALALPGATLAQNSPYQGSSPYGYTGGAYPQAGSASSATRRAQLRQRWAQLSPQQRQQILQRYRLKQRSQGGMGRPGGFARP